MRSLSRSRWLAAWVLCLLGGGLLMRGAALRRAHADGEPARNVVIVLDRGAGAADAAVGDAGNVLRIAEALSKRGSVPVVLAQGSNARGRAVSTELDPSAESLTNLAQQEDYAFRGPSDVRVALPRALAAQKGSGALLLVLVGPFRAAPSEETPEGEEDRPPRDPLADVVATWNDKAPVGSRILPVGIGAEALALLGGARGLQASGFVVIAVGTPEVVVDPFSPLPGETSTPDALTARVRLLVDVVRLGPPGQIEPVFGLRSDIEADRIETKMIAGLHEFGVERRQRDGRTATLSFQPIGGAQVLRLCDQPTPLTLQWDKLIQAVRLIGPGGKVAPVFAAVDVEVGAPLATAFRLQRARSGPTPAWRATCEDGTMPLGLQVAIGDETKVSEEIAACEVRVSFTAFPATPMEAQGAILLQADGLEEQPRLPYEIRVQPGRAALALTPNPQALPAATKDLPVRLEIKALNRNVPPTLQVEVQSPGGHERFLDVLVRTPDGSSRSQPLSKPLPVAVGVAHELTFTPMAGMSDTLPWPCQLTFRALPVPGLTLEASEAGDVGPVELRLRTPRLERVGPEPAYELIDGELVARTPILLRLDTDGGDGDWALALLQAAPTLRVPRDAPTRWKAVGKGAGEWEVVPLGPWSGAPRRIFNALDVRVPVTIDWDAGAAPAHLEIPVHIPPRWGNKGYILVGLAAAAVLLGLLVVFQMRPVLIDGTLIYTVDGLQGTVGRLDLAPVGRRRATVSADERGKLTLDKGGTPLLRVHPTRVGGMLEVVESDGPNERRLLVDGLSLRAGRHLLRYVSGDTGEAATAPEPVEDLLGEEYDIASGRIQALGDADPADKPGRRGQ